MTNDNQKNPLEEPIVLILKDFDADGEFIKKLQDNGFLVQLVRDASKAQRIGEGKPTFWKPKLFLVDMILSGSSGFEIVRRLHDKFGMKRVPIVMSSPYQSKEDELEATNAGAFAVLKKPLTLESIQKVLAESEARRTSAEAMNQAIQNSQE